MRLMRQPSKHWQLSAQYDVRGGLLSAKSSDSTRFDNTQPLSIKVPGRVTATTSMNIRFQLIRRANTAPALANCPLTDIESDGGQRQLTFSGRK